MKDRYAKISFLASGHVIQDILITDPNISASRLQIMLDSGEAVTTVQEGKDVCVTTGDWLSIGEVIYVEAELDYEDFQLEDHYTQPTPKPQIFNASRMALAAAVGDFIEEPNKTIDEIMAELHTSGSFDPPLNVVEEYHGLSGILLLKEIELAQRGYRGLMEMAFNAGALKQELI